MRGNEYLQEAAPWTAFKTDPARAGHVVRTGLELARLFAVLASPFIPDASAKVLTGLGCDPKDLAWPEERTRRAGDVSGVPEEGEDCLSRAQRWRVPQPSEGTPGASQARSTSNNQQANLKKV